MNNTNINNKSNLTALAIVLAVGFIIGAWIISSTWRYVSRSNVTITVTGSASENITSDLAIWRGSFSAESNTLVDAYAKLKSSNEKVISYLTSKGFPQDKIIVSSINTMNLYINDKEGIPTNQISGYRLSQDVSIESNDVNKIDKLSREATELINEGVEFNSLSPEFLYTKLGKASADAKERAEQIAESTGNSIGEVRSSRMGVMQINAKNSTEISDYGMNNTSSLEKTVTSVVNVSFSIK